MKRIQSTILKAKRFVMVAVMASGPWSAGIAAENGCWVDFWEFPNYLGEHVRIEGPIRLSTLTEVKGDNWDRRIDSLKVGPNAKVTIYENLNFKLTLTEMAKYPDLMKALGITETDVRQDSEIKYEPGQTSHHLGEVNFHRKTRSLKIECVD